MRYLAHRIYMHIHLKSRYNSKIKYKHMLLHNFFKYLPFFTEVGLFKNII